MVTSTIRLLCSFTLDKRRFGIDVRDVQEVLLAPEVHGAPFERSAVVGVINLRGHILSVVDLRIRFGLPARERGAPTSHIVVRTSEGNVSLLVDSFGEFLRIPNLPIESLTYQATDLSRRYFRGAVELAEGLVPVLDVAAVASAHIFRNQMNS